MVKTVKAALSFLISFSIHLCVVYVLFLFLFRFLLIPFGSATTRLGRHKIQNTQRNYPKWHKERRGPQILSSLPKKRDKEESFVEKKKEKKNKNTAQNRNENE